MDFVSRTFGIGELARRTGLPVKTIRFYSDEGLLPPTDRTTAGYRRYDTRALARLELIRTLRELGLGLAEVEQVLAERVTVPELATRHLDALDEQIRRLRLRRAVLRAVVKRESELEEVKLMNRLASMPDDERARLVDEFWDEMSRGLDIDPAFAERMRSAKPALPDDPSPEQVEAWVEFAELIQDADFRATIRRMSERQSEARAAGEPAQTPETTEQWFERLERANGYREAGLAPDSPEGQALAAELAGEEDRRKVADRIASGMDARAERYWQLLAIMNGWPQFPTRTPAVEWLVAALRA